MASRQADPEESVLSVRIRYSPTECIYRTVRHFCADRDAFEVILKVEDRAMSLQGCQLNRETKDFSIELISADSLDQDCILLEDVPSCCLSRKPMLVSIFDCELYKFYPEKDVEVFNICGKIVATRAGGCESFFRPEVLPCLINRDRQVVSFSHLYGNFRHKRMRNIVIFKGFRCFNNFNMIMCSVLREEVVESSEIQLDMLSMCCNLGRYLGVAQDCYLQKRLELIYGDSISFLPRTDEQNNCLLFKIHDLQRMTGRFSSCNKVNCCISRKGNFIARINWSRKTLWNEEKHGEMISIVRHLKRLIKDLV